MKMSNIVSLVCMLIFAHIHIDWVKENPTPSVVVASLVIAVMLAEKICDLIVAIVPKPEPFNDEDEDEEDVDQ